MADGLCRRIEDTLPLAAAVMVFGSAFAPFDLHAADFLLLIFVGARLLI